MSSNAKADLDKAGDVLTKAIGLVFASLFTILFLAVGLSFFTAWVLMVGLGNVGVHVSYVGSLPLAFLINWKFAANIKS